MTTVDPIPFAERALAERDRQIAALQLDNAVLRDALDEAGGGIRGALAAKIHDLPVEYCFFLLLSIIVFVGEVLTHVAH